jgi:hypothetical protein
MKLLAAFDASAERRGAEGELGVEVAVVVDVE